MTTPKLLYTLEQPHGLGELYFQWQKGESHSLLATTGTDATVAIHDRSGQLLERIKLQGLCGGMEWDNDGDYLAMITPNSNSVLLWECHANKRVTIETGLREPPSCLAWAYGEPLLAIGTQKGNLALYNHHTTKRIPIIGKHTKKITCSAWNKDSILVLASEDKSLSINNSDGDTLRIISLRDTPNDLQFSEMKTDERVAGENTISLVVGKRTLYLYNLLNPENPIELAFQQRYGSIVSYKWYGDGYILIGFSAGFIIAISTHIKEVGEELFQVKNHKENLTDIAVCDTLAASCGDGHGSVWGSVAPAGGAERAAWGAGGRLVAAAGRGALAVYVTALPPLHAACATRALALTSLAEATLYQCIPLADGADHVDPLNKSEPVALATYTFPTEPSVIAVGAAHVCCASGAHAWFYALAGGVVAARPAARRHYAGAVQALRLAGHYAAALFQGKAMLHLIEQSDTSQPEREAMIFPEPHMQDANIVDIHLTGDFFIFVTDQGHIEYFGVEEWRSAARYRHAAGVASVHCDISGARAVLADARRRAHVYCPAAAALAAVPPPRRAAPPPAPLRGVIWDICLSDRNVFIIYTEDTIDTYYYAANSIDGPHVDYVASTTILTGQIPLILFSGDVYCYATGGIIQKVSLESHNTAGLAEADAEKRAANQRRHVEKLMLLRRFSDAALYCDALADPEVTRTLADRAAADLNLEFAIRMYTRLSDVAMVWALEDALHIEDLSILCGMVCACLGRGEAAARWLEGAGAGPHALELHAARGDWARAAALAAAACPERAADVTLHHAQHLELTADYHEALANYEKSLIHDNTDDPKVREHNSRCEAGIARTSIRCGDVARGVTTAMKHAHHALLLKDCALLLEEEKQYSHAAALYDHAGNTEKAASLYIRLKSWLKVEALLPKINSPSIHIQYAKAKEAEGRYSDALKSYLRAQDYESAIRLNLEKLDDIDEAVALVQESKSVQGAKMVANYFQNSDDPSSAIKFLVMSLCYDEAFQLARKNGKLHLYGEILIQTSHARSEDFKSLALHFEGEKNHLLAGKFYFHAGEYSKAMSHLLKAGGGSEEEENEAIGIAIDAAAASDDERLTRRLIEFLLGETDGTPREPRHLFRLYMAKRQFTEAAKTAVIIAGAECAAARYREARDVLRDALRGAGLRARRLPAPADVRRALAALHSYILVRTHVKRGRHDLAARLLLRIAADVSFFPTQQHQVSILTSTVIECGRAGLKHQAHHWAKVLMQPEYRSQIDPKYSKKIESVVRHAPRGPAGGAGGAGGAGAEGEAGTACPVCSVAGLAAADLHCASCEAYLPFCIATGLHIVKDDLTACPECDFPAIYSEFTELLQEDGKCPMCGENVDYRRLVKIDDVSLYLDVGTTE
ncbi:WD repeat-containing protein 19 isoform X2 [Galleria mellonella]|uniref:WD repeat-containing protein 19 isoform X2 n=1 Tax=Galleria mellonella TaxID=7137 RepID=A0ABM3MKB4_GALME|nr:WD repeat-containing protein 19 isoform X2 [Galleria mellonella]